MDYPKTYSIVLADEQPLILAGLKSVLFGERAFVVVGTFQTGHSALEAIRRNVPDIAVIDINIPEDDGLAVLSAIKLENLPTRLVLLATSISDQQIFEAISAGLDGLVLKRSPDTLVSCLYEVAVGRRWLPREFVKPAIDREIKRHQAGRLLLSELTPRQLEIVQLVGDGLSNRMIGHRLGLAEGTVKVHLHNIYQKLGISNRAHLASQAATHQR